MIDSCEVQEVGTGGIDGMHSGSFDSFTERAKLDLNSWFSANGCNSASTQRMYLKAISTIRVPAKRAGNG